MCCYGVLHKRSFYNWDRKRNSQGKVILGGRTCSRKEKDGTPTSDWRRPSICVLKEVNRTFDYHNCFERSISWQSKKGGALKSLFAQGGFSKADEGKTVRISGDVLKVDGIKTAILRAALAGCRCCEEGACFATHCQVKNNHGCYSCRIAHVDPNVGGQIRLEAPVGVWKNGVLHEEGSTFVCTVENPQASQDKPIHIQTGDSNWAEIEIEVRTLDHECMIPSRNIYVSYA